MRSGRIAFFVQVSLERDANKVLSSVESFMKRGGPGDHRRYLPLLSQAKLIEFGSAAQRQRRPRRTPAFRSSAPTKALQPHRRRRR